MTAKLVLCVVLISVSTAFGQYDSLHIAIVGDSVKISHMDVNWGCGAVFVSDVRVTTDSVIIVEHDTATSIHLPCLCTYSIYTTLTGLPAGTYTAAIYTTVPGYPPYLRHTRDFTVGPAVHGFSTGFRQSACGVIGGVDDGPSRSEGFSLSVNYPNPFNPRTIISYEVPQDSFVSLIVYSLTGEEVSTLVEGVQPSGKHAVTWNAAGVASGVYFCRLQSGSRVRTTRMILIR